MRIVVAALAAVLLVPASPAHADTAWFVGGGDGTCGLETVDTVSPGTQSGTVQAGPLPLPAPYETFEATVTCSIQVGTNDTHVDSDAVSATGPRTRGVVALAPTPVGFALGPDDDVYGCSRLDIVGGPTLYWSSAYDVWLSDPTVQCDLAVSLSAPGPAPVAMCGFTSLRADITYTAPVTTVSAPVAWTLELEAECTGSVPLAGWYDLTFTGSGTESCAGGTGSATVTGTGPNGAVTSGTWSYERTQGSYDGFRVAGSFTDARGTFAMRWWLLADPAAYPCPLRSAALRGPGVVGA